MHRLARGARVAGLDRVQHPGVVFNGGRLADAADGALPAGETDFGERVEDESEDKIAAGLGERAVEIEIGHDGGGVVGRGFQLGVDAAQGADLLFRGALRSEARGVRLDGKPGFVELLQTLGDVGDQQLERTVQGSVQFVDDPDAGAVLHLEQTLLLEPFGGLAHDGAAHTELLGERAFGGQPALRARVVAADQTRELLANALDKRGRALEGGDVHGRGLVESWSDGGMTAEGFRRHVAAMRHRLGLTARNLPGFDAN